MRELKTNDIFKMSKILKKINLKVSTEGKTQAQVGAEMIISIGENLHLAQDEVNEFMGSMIGISAQEFGELPLSETMNYLDEFKKLKDIENFIKLAIR